MNYNLLLYILAGVYLLAINLYGVLILIFQKNAKSVDEDSNGGITDGRLIFAGLLGGAIGIFVTMFIAKYRLKNIVLMILLPLFIALDVFLIVNLILGRIKIF
jgi:uncharacterized membrane protein YsdA (DUF1294 family)